MIKNWFKKIKEKTGAVALILVVMITSLTLVSAVIIALINISELTANYHISESEKVQVNIDSCVNDALRRLASSTVLTGKTIYAGSASSTNCSYDISPAIFGIKWVTSTATSTSDIGSWTKSVVVEVNVSNSPIMIQSYKDIIN